MKSIFKRGDNYILRCVLFIMFFGVSLCMSAQNNYQDVVYLKNGGIIRGTLIELIPDKSLKIETVDGNVFVFQMDEVEKITKEQALQTINYGITKLPNYTYFFGASISPYGGEKTPFLAGFLSFVIPGLGQFYNGDIGGGIFYLGINVLNNSLLISTMKYGAGGNPLLWITGITINVASITNAYRTAKNVNIVRGYYLGNGTHLNLSPTVIKPALALMKNNSNSMKDNTLGLALQLTF